MKSPNKHITRIVVWSVSGSILTSSCIDTFPDLSIYENVQHLSDIGLPAISVNLSKQQSDYYDYISELAQRIISDKDFAKDFNENPQQYLKSIEVDVNEEIADAALMRITTALADDEISEAIANNDIKQYLRLMHQKGLLDNAANDYANLLTIEERKQILQSLGIADVNEQQLETMAIAAVSFLFYIAVIAVSYVGVAYTAIATINMGVGLTVVYSTAAATKTKVSGERGYQQLSKNLDIYLIATEYNDEIILKDTDLTNIINDVIEVYEELYIDEAEIIDMDKLKNTIILNLNNQPIIAEKQFITEDNDYDI